MLLNSGNIAVNLTNLKATRERILFIHESHVSTTAAEFRHVISYKIGNEIELDLQWLTV